MSLQAFGSGVQATLRQQLEDRVRQQMAQAQMENMARQRDLEAQRLQQAQTAQQQEQARFDAEAPHRAATTGYIKTQTDYMNNEPQRTAEKRAWDVQQGGIEQGYRAQDAARQHQYRSSELAQQERARVAAMSGIMGGATPPAGPGAAQGGEAALQGVDPNIQQLVKSLADYSYPLPSGTALRTPQWMQILALAKQYDPSFDSTQYNTRQQLRKDFTSGKSAQNVRSLNTAVAHLGKLNESGKALNNTSIPAWNAVANYAAQSAGDPRIGNFKTAATAVAGELANVFKNTGGTDQEINKWMATINGSQSPEQIQGTIQTAVDLLGGRLKALQSQYQTGMGKPANFHLLSDESRKTLQAMGVDLGQLEPDGNQGSTTGGSVKIRSITPIP